MPLALQQTLQPMRALLGRAVCACVILLFCLDAGAVQARRAAAPVTVLTIDGPIDPASADYTIRGIARAERDGSQLLILQIDTPGGLDTSMRLIIKAILASPVPVAAFVAPSGARAASAGVYLLYASHVAAMAPGTNLGAATPVQIGIGPDPPGTSKPGSGPNPRAKTPSADRDKDAGGSAMARKQVNDAAAYLRSLAQLRKRNANWAERAVRESVSLPAQEALHLNVVDAIAADAGALARQLDGRQIAMRDATVTLRTGDVPLVRHAPDWRSRVLGVVANPSVALLLMMLGVYGLIFEFMNPGTAIPGVVGAICLLLAMYALQLLPVNYAGLALMVLGIAFMLAEAFVPSFGVLGFGGVLAFASGALILIDTDLPGYGMPLLSIAIVAAGSAVLFALTAGVAVKTRRRPAAHEPGDPVGAVGAVVRATAEGSWIALQGELWQVRSNVALQDGQLVRVAARAGLTLDVVPIDLKEGRTHHAL